MISLSTAFHIDSHTTWKSLLDDTLRMGYRSVELSVKVPEGWLNDIEASVAQNEVTISSVHNYCPRLDNLPPNRTVYSGYILTADDEEERRLALDLTLKSIETAARVRAKVLVVHAGQISTEPSGPQVHGYIHQFGPTGSLKEQIFASFREDRARKAPKVMSLLMKALDVILPAAEKAGIMVGLENRYYVHEVPDTTETIALLDKFKGAPLGYWHDTGHAETFVRIGWVKNHVDMIEPLKDHLVGFHLHDMKRLQDHYAPGSGDLDFDVLKPYIKASQCKVVEAHNKSTSQEVSRAIPFLQEKGF